MVVEGLGALVGRAKGALTAALAYRSRPVDKSEITSSLPEGTKPTPPHNTRDSSNDGSTPKPKPRPATNEEASMRGALYEGVPMQEYLAAPNPHTLGIPVADVHHPSTPRRPPLHPRSNDQDRMGHPQQRLPNKNQGVNSHSGSTPHLASPPTSSSHARSREYYGSDRHVDHGNSLHQDYGHQISTPGSLRPSSRVSRSTESFGLDQFPRNDHRPRSDRKRADEGRTRHRTRRNSEDRGRRRRSSSPPTSRRSRSRESERSRKLSGQTGCPHGSRDHLTSSPSRVGIGNNSGTIPSVYTISGRECFDLQQQQQQQPQQLQHGQQSLQHPVTQDGQEPAEQLGWRETLSQVLANRDIKLIKPLLPTPEEAILTIGQSQVIALVCGIITAFLMVLALFSSDWLLAVGWRQGLFAHCIGEGAPKPLPFQINADTGCHTARDEPYIMASAALCVICLLLDVFATIMTGLGLSSNDPAVKSRYYRIAVWVMTVALIAILIALILYPVFFAQELELGNRTLWEFGWAYGVGWGAAIFLFGGVVLLLCDQEEEEIYYKERTIIHAENDSRA